MRHFAVVRHVARRSIVAGLITLIVLFSPTVLAFTDQSAHAQGTPTHLRQPLALGPQQLLDASIQYSGGDVLLYRNGQSKLVAKGDRARLNPLFAQFGSVSPDGRHLLYVAASGQDFRNVTFTVVDLATLNKTVVTRIPSGFWVHSPRWSPDSRQLIYVKANAGTFAPEIWIEDISSHHARAVATGGALTHRSLEGFIANAPGWSADGNSIVFYDSAFQPTVQWSVSIGSGT